MGNHNEDEGSFRGHGLNRHNEISELHRWRAGMSFTDVLNQPLTHMDQEFQQWRTQPRGGLYSEQASRNLLSGEFMPRYSQGSIATSSRAMEDQRFYQPVLPTPLSQSQDRTTTHARGGNWSRTEDEMLCHAWVAVSTDPITGDSQKKQTFWKRVFDNFVKQHEEVNELSTRNQKACDQRFQLIRAECNKWSAALKMITDHPRSGENAADTLRATHSLYRGQNCNKIFKLEHCWEILRTCAKYSELHGAKRNTVASDEIQLLDRTSHEVVNEDSPTPTIGKRPPGRRSSKDKASGKRQKSEDANSSIGDRIVQSIDDLNVTSAAAIEASNLRIEQDQKSLLKWRRLQMLRERIMMEKEFAAFDKLAYNEGPGAIGSPTDCEKRLAMRQARIEQLMAEADAILSDNGEEHVNSRTCRNLNLSFDDEVETRC